MNTFQLTCFLSVAQHLNFARAAEELNITQPAVTHQIQTLEEELSVKLFHRTTRNVEMTTEGKLFIGDAMQILQISSRAKKRFEHPGNGKSFLFLSAATTIPRSLPSPELCGRCTRSSPTFTPAFRSSPFSMCTSFWQTKTLTSSLISKNRIPKKPPAHTNISCGCT